MSWRAELRANDVERRPPPTADRGHVEQPGERDDAPTPIRKQAPLDIRKVMDEEEEEEIRALLAEEEKTKLAPQMAEPLAPLVVVKPSAFKREEPNKVAPRKYNNTPVDVKVEAVARVMADGQHGAQTRVAHAMGLDQVNLSRWQRDEGIASLARERLSKTEAQSVAELDMAKTERRKSREVSPLSVKVAAVARWLALGSKTGAATTIASELGTKPRNMHQWTRDKDILDLARAQLELAESKQAPPPSAPAPQTVVQPVAQRAPEPPPPPVQHEYHPPPPMPTWISQPPPQPQYQQPQPAPQQPPSFEAYINALVDKRVDERLRAMLSGGR